MMIRTTTFGLLLCLLTACHRAPQPQAPRKISLPPPRLLVRLPQTVEVSAAVCHLGTWYLADSKNFCLWRVSPQGEGTSFSRPGQGPGLWLLQAPDRIEHFALDGAYLEILQLLPPPDQKGLPGFASLLALEGGGFLIATTLAPHRFYHFDPNGRFLERFSETGFTPGPGSFHAEYPLLKRASGGILAMARSSGQTWRLSQSPPWPSCPRERSIP